jgi:hypothetical protein
MASSFALYWRGKSINVQPVAVAHALQADYFGFFARILCGSTHKAESKASAAFRAAVAGISRALRRRRLAEMFRCVCQRTEA